MIDDFQNCLKFCIQRRVCMYTYKHTLNLNCEYILRIISFHYISLNFAKFLIYWTVKCYKCNFLFKCLCYCFVNVVVTYCYIISVISLHLLYDLLESFSGVKDMKKILNLWWKKNRTVEVNFKIWFFLIRFHSFLLNAICSQMSLKCLEMLFFVFYHYNKMLSFFSSNDAYFLQLFWLLNFWELFDHTF